MSDVSGLDGKGLELSGVMLDVATIDQGDLDLSALDRVCSHWRHHPHTKPTEVLERIGKAQIAVTNKVVLDRAVLERASDLRLICIAATGTNNVDLVAAGEQNIAVANVVRYATPSVVQHVFALILALTTRLPGYQRAVADGGWQQHDRFCLMDYPIRELAGRTFGIVGYGELGQAVARVAEAFGMQVLIAQRPGGPFAEGRLPLDQLLPQVDVLSLHCPLTEATRGLIGARELGLMRPDALLINTARGGIVDEQALADALRAGTIGGAGVDVLSAEPPRQGNPLLAPDIPNLIVTPHIAWASREARQRVVEGIAANIAAFRAGTLTSCA
ncbi:2-hydroxyacid dehydrogenase [Thiorhodovibrio frisius]|uniref:Lactate dehydrogenase-like oxidoreductase n=1 Tax=Thiorhodovibrio frisius TaxID=631362 RepID=H8YWL0_9GAMM|nr:2-hydroxyacid dehydrogenase [Thiorhodovibrio frisius]EIC22836.1 lactate dehydrogenase-like oxidoreductase [Thiorhodovibrio frisius]WPL22907.1 Putative 2-hydroxyacid dehydrogenase [Thiorhodovibrio frisius]